MRRRGRSPVRPWLRAALLVVAGFGAARLADEVVERLDRAELFRVRTVRVAGIVHADEAALRRRLGLFDQGLLTADLKAARRRLLEDPWVWDAALSRSLPDTVSVRVVETVPVALERRGDRIVLLDGRGQVLDQGPDPGRFTVPWLEGASRAGNGAEAARVRGAGFLLALQAELGDELLQTGVRVRALDVSRSDRLVVRADGHPDVDVSGPESLDELRRYLRVAPQLEAHFGELARVDARWRHRLFLTRADG